MRSSTAAAGEAPRLRGWRAVLAWGSVSIGLAAMAVTYLVVGASPSVGLLGAALFVGIVASLGIVGALIATRRPANPVGWILWLAGLLYAFVMASDEIGRAALAASSGVPGPELVGLAWFGSLLFMPTTVMIAALVPLFFPDGRLLSRRWRWVAAVAIAAIVVLVLQAATATELPMGNESLANPLAAGAGSAWSAALELANLVTALVVFPAAVLACVVRYRRGDQTTRHQLKWFAAAVTWTIGSFTLSAVDGLVGFAGWFLGLVGLALLPISIGIAIFRYRLYDIDRIISRTVGWLVITLILAVVFVGGVLLAQSVLEPLTGGSTLGVALATLVAAALFSPVRSRVQRAVDRRFNRARYDADRIAAAFGDRLRDQVSLDALQADLDRVVALTLEPSSLSVWVREGPGR